MATSISGITAVASGTSSTGLGTGIDVQQFVKLAVAGQQANITSLQSQQTNLNAQTSALDTITTDLNNLSSAVFALNDPLGALNSELSTSSNSSVVSATASSTALTGTHSVTVSALATTSSYYTDPVATASTTLAAGSFTIQQGATGTPVKVTIDSSDNTLTGLAQAINNQNGGVSASVITDANGSRLALVSTLTGAPGDLTVAGNTTGLTFNKAVTGSNASLVVDGVPISSTSNTVVGAISGVTLNLSSTTPSTPTSPATPIIISVSPDTTQATTAVNSLVSAYNKAVTDINAQFAVAADGSGGGALEADGSLRDAQSQLLSAISFSVPGNNGIVNLSSIGVNLQNDGTLSVDSGTLASALSSNYGDVQNLLQNASSGFSANLTSVLSNLVGPGNGELTLDATSIAQSSTALSSQISDLQAALVVQEANLTTTYAQVNVTLQELPLLQSQLSQQITSIA